MAAYSPSPEWLRYAPSCDSQLWHSLHRPEDTQGMSSAHGSGRKQSMKLEGVKGVVYFKREARGVS